MASVSSTRHVSITACHLLYRRSETKVSIPRSSTLPCPGHSTRIQANPGGSKWNGRNLVGIQVNSNLIPSKNNLIIQTQIFIHSRSFQVIPGHSRWNPSIPGHSRWNPSKKKDDYFSHIPGSFPPYSRSFQVHSRFIPATFWVHSSHILGQFQVNLLFYILTI